MSAASQPATRPGLSAAEKKARVEALRTLIAQGKRDANEKAVANALREMADLGSVNGVDTFIENLDFTDYKPSPEDVLAGRDMRGDYPAQDGLRAVGAPAVDGILDAVARGQLSEQGVWTAGRLIDTILGTHAKAKEKVDAFVAKLSDKEQVARIKARSFYEFFEPRQ